MRHSSSILIALGYQAQPDPPQGFQGNSKGAGSDRPLPVQFPALHSAAAAGTTPRCVPCVPDIEAGPLGFDPQRRQAPGSSSDRLRPSEVRIRIGLAGIDSDSDRFCRARFRFDSASPGQVRIRIGFRTAKPGSGQFRKGLRVHADSCSCIK